MDYRWQLRKGSKKEICPACGQRRFVPYVAAADGVTLAGPEFGRCDRESNCGYQKYPSGKSTNGIEHKEPPKLKPLRFFQAAVQVSTNTPLFDWACRLIGVLNACTVWNRYKVGRDGKRTVFWQIAIDGTIRSGKSIPYKSDGHRDKTDKYPASWLHKSPAWKDYREGEELQQCFFGEHLLSGRPDAPVAIVESEKTAIMMSCYSREYIWLACGGSQGLKNPERNKVLSGRKIMLVPDNGQYWNWYAAAEANGWGIIDTLEKYPIFDGCDILDVIEAGVLGEDLLYYKQKKMNNEN